MQDVSGLDFTTVFRCLVIIVLGIYFNISGYKWDPTGGNSNINRAHNKWSKFLYVGRQLHNYTH
jgi:hypothetical protein